MRAWPSSLSRQSATPLFRIYVCACIKKMTMMMTNSALKQVVRTFKTPSPLMGWAASVFVSLPPAPRPLASSACRICRNVFDLFCGDGELYFLIFLCQYVTKKTSRKKRAGVLCIYMMDFSLFFPHLRGSSLQLYIFLYKAEKSLFFSFFDLIQSNFSQGIYF